MIEKAFNIAAIQITNTKCPVNSVKPVTDFLRYMSESGSLLKSFNNAK